MVQHILVCEMYERVVCRILSSGRSEENKERLAIICGANMVFQYVDSPVVANRLCFSRIIGISFGTVYFVLNDNRQAPTLFLIIIICKGDMQ